MDKAIQEQLSQRIASFDGSLSSLRAAIGDLDAVWQSDSCPEATRQQFRSAWGVLEQIYAAALDRQGSCELSSEEIADSRAALATLGSLIEASTD